MDDEGGGSGVTAAAADNEERSPSAGAEVKGWRNGLLLFLPAEGTWQAVIEQVHQRLDEAKARSFWRGAQTTIDCGNRSITADELEALQHRIKGGFGLVPVAVITTDPVTRSAAEKLALTVYETLPIVRKPAPREGAISSGVGDGEPASVSVPVTAPAVAAAIANTVVNNALYLPQTVRSGQRIVHDGHLIICGDVNAGAEVVAGGDILVFGTLRGLAHAGCYGEEAARIVASSLRPPQLRIAAKIARSPEEAPRTTTGKTAAPEMARIVNGEIQVFPL